MMRLYKLDDKVLSIKGNAGAFLNGISSNSLEAPLNAFLNQHGRIIATFRQQRISDAEFLISVPAMAIESLLKHLERFVKLSQVRLEPGHHTAYMDLDAVKTYWDTAVHNNSISAEGFTLFRLDHQIPLMGVDYQADEFILNVHEHDYVSYTKGCFLGQEPVAKVHNRSRPSRCLRVLFEDQCDAQGAAKMTSKVVDPDSGRTKGFIFSPLLPS